MFVGIDVSKDRLDVHLRPSGEAFVVSRDGAGITALVDRLGPIDPVLVVLEATGGFEIAVAARIAGAGLPLAVVNPVQVRAFARATGRLAKTDRLDAELIALGSIDRRRLAALVGVAPLNCDAGAMRGQRAIAGGGAGAACRSWPSSPPFAGTRPSATSIFASGPVAGPPWPPWSPPCASSSPSSTRSSRTESHG